jgi:ABC-type proline/glycine betaine transport system ATPase subunit
MVTHDVDALIAWADRVAVLAEQRIIAAAPLAEVVRLDHPFVRHFFEGQTDRCAQPLRRAEPPSSLKNAVHTLGSAWAPLRTPTISNEVFMNQ